MLSWLAGKLIAHNMGRLREGDPSPTVRLYAADPDAYLTRRGEAAATR